MFMEAEHDELVAGEDVELGRFNSIRDMDEFISQQPGPGGADIVPWDDNRDNYYAAVNDIEYAQQVQLSSIQDDNENDPDYRAAVAASLASSRSPDHGLAAGATPHQHLIRKREKMNILDVEWAPPDVEKGEKYAKYVQPRKGGKGGSLYDYYHTTTGRHCCLGSLGEQFDLWEEGQISEFSIYGPGVTNYFKFMKWSFWLFTILTVISLPMISLNVENGKAEVSPVHSNAMRILVQLTHIYSSSL
jgi:hypothetical protein